MVFLAACGAVTPEALTSFQTTEVNVDGQSLQVMVADTEDKRGQGFQGVDDMPGGIDGMLFVWEAPRTTSFHMRNVSLPLEAWWFDEDGHLVGSADMNTCVDGDCVSYASPGEVMWALETATGEWDFDPGANLSFSE